MKYTLSELKNKIQYNMDKAMQLAKLEKWSEALKYSDIATILLKKESELIEKEHSKIMLKSQITDEILKSQNKRFRN